MFYDPTKEAQTEKTGPFLETRVSKSGPGPLNRKSGTKKEPIPIFGGAPKGPAPAGHPVRDEPLRERAAGPAGFQQTELDGVWMRRKRLTG